MCSQLLTDNASNCRAMWKLVESKYKHITCGGCVPHCLDLLSEKWGKVQWVKESISEAQALAHCVINHQCLLAEYRKIGGKMLQRPGETRFSSYFIACSDVLGSREELDTLYNGAVFKVRCTVTFVW